ncbi:Cytochrome d1 heme domain protein [Oopsacas minuta]|uniref:Cytochrome d1 heme domain protein n=1 Tax=Oopsacas minuta TaxID=111878 RepID=A0AAV7JMZ0_9METZ|nr:Cytochrome d1 heme domain protein [Oopsacas minuta]
MQQQMHELTNLFGSYENYIETEVNLEIQVFILSSFLLMDSALEVECQFISAGYNLKQWDLIKQHNTLNSLSDHEVSKTPGTEFLSPIHSAGRHLFSSVVIDSTANTIAALIVSNQELYISTLKEGMGFKKIILNAPQCIVFIGLNDSFIAVGCNKGVFLVDTKIPKVIEFIRLPLFDHKSDSVICIDCSHDPKNYYFIAFGTEFGNLFYFTCFRDVCNPEQIGVNDPSTKIISIKFSPHNYSYIATAYSNSMVNIWDLDTKTIVYSVSFNSSTLCTSLDFSPFRNDILCMGRNDGVVSLIDFTKMQKVIQFTIPESVITGLLFVHNGIHMIVGDAIGQIHIYNLRTLKASRAYRLHSSSLKSLAIKRAKFSISGIQPSTIPISTNSEFTYSTNPLISSKSPPLEENSIQYEQKSRSNLVTQRSYISTKTSNITNLPDSFESPIIISPLRANNFDSKSSIPSTTQLSHKNSKFYQNIGTGSDLVPPINNDYSIPSKKESQKLTSVYLNSPPYKSNNANLTGLARPKEFSPIVYPIFGPDKHSQEFSNLQNKVHFPELGNDIPNCNFVKDSIINETLPTETDLIPTNIYYATLQKLFDNNSNEMKEFFGQQMINLLGELTRNVTNQQIQIALLHNKLDLLNDSIENIHKTLSNNPHLL